MGNTAYQYAVQVHRKIHSTDVDLDFQPLSVVSDVEFIQFLNTLEPRCKSLFCRDYKQSTDSQIFELVKDVHYCIDDSFITQSATLA